MNDQGFLLGLAVHDDFSAVSSPDSYTQLPDDWHVVITDVRNSTVAISDGKYKSVNIAGVSVITALLNLVKPDLLPYAFGGDGAVVCVPPGIVDKARLALSATRRMTAAAFDLDLRAGIVPVEIIKQNGCQVLVTRHRMSTTCIQTAFTGGGVEYAESLVKGDATAGEYSVNEGPDDTAADYSGLECRWDNVPSKHGEIISLIVKVTGQDNHEMATLYRHIIDKIHAIYGTDDKCRPITADGLHFARDWKKLDYEAGARTYKLGRTGRVFYLFKIILQGLLGSFMMACNLEIGGVPWGKYKHTLARNTDFKKFDGTLRSVLSGTGSQRELLEEFLGELHSRGQCVYGLHVSKSAIVTCLINDRINDHVHFVDGADGGYALAAVQFKQQLKMLQG